MKWLQRKYDKRNSIQLNVDFSRFDYGKYQDSMCLKVLQRSLQNTIERVHCTHCAVQQFPFVMLWTCLCTMVLKMVIQAAKYMASTGYTEYKWI